MAKWCARFALGLSNSVPGVMVADEDIHHEDDVGMSSLDHKS
jgi:RNA-dependent RNA polymerase